MKPTRKQAAEIGPALMDWYGANKRVLPWRETGDPYRIWVSEVMLQQTRVDTVIPYYHRFLDRFPDIRSLASAPAETVLKMWEGLGYYARARNLHRAAGEVVERYQGRIPEDPVRFLKLPGVGEYIGAAVMSIAFGKPLAVVDGNVKRVLSRLFLMDAPANDPKHLPIFRETAQILLAREDPGTYNQAVMELGALICKPKNPSCSDCPLHSLCVARIKGKTDTYPRKKAKGPIPEYPETRGVVIYDGLLLITRRKAEGLLGGLWEFPGGRIEPNEIPAEGCIRKIREKTGLTVSIEAPLARVRHAYTHFKVTVDVFLCTSAAAAVELSGPVEYRWIHPDQIDDYPLPGTHHKFLSLLKKRLRRGNRR